MIKITTILVLGISGMLGSMIFDYLSRNPNLNVYGTVRNSKFKKEHVLIFDAYNVSQLEQEQFLDINIEYIINCIGITKPFSKDDDPAGVIRAIKINADFPWELSKYAKKHGIKILQIATDCVFSGKKGNYNEDDPHDPLDVYGKTKSLGEVFDGTTLNIRTSIIGPEYKKETTFLLEWFLSQKQGGTIGGFAHHIWNGTTTLQFAQLCEKIINTNGFGKLVDNSHVYHFIPNTSVNKYELMNIFNDIFEKQLKINCVNIPEQKVDRTLTTKYDELTKFYKKTDINSALIELKKYIENNKVFKL